VYDGQLREAVLRIKQVAGDALAEALGTLFARKLRQRWERDGPQVVIPVPLHWRRRLTRGYNQAESVARGIAGELRLPLVTRAVRRVRATPKQTGVSAAERRRNVEGAFRPTTLAAVKGLRVLLVDDVLTTGATADATAAAVRTAGAAQVHVAVLAHR
jgi:ComF family protein